jgi:hypothetical protein
MRNGIKTYMAQRDVPPYKTLMNSLIKHHGNQTRACDAIGLSDYSFHRLMRDDDITVANARKIMSGYTAMKNEREAA